MVNSIQEAQTNGHGAPGDSDSLTELRKLKSLVRSSDELQQQNKKEKTAHDNAVNAIPDLASVAWAMQPPEIKTMVSNLLTEHGFASIQASEKNNQLTASGTETDESDLKPDRLGASTLTATSFVQTLQMNLTSNRTDNTTPANPDAPAQFKAQIAQAIQAAQATQTTLPANSVLDSTRPATETAAQKLQPINEIQFKPTGDTSLKTTASTVVSTPVAPSPSTVPTSVTSFIPTAALTSSSATNAIDRSEVTAAQPMQSTSTTTTYAGAVPKAGNDNQQVDSLKKKHSDNNTDPGQAEALQAALMSALNTLSIPAEIEQPAQAKTTQPQLAKEQVEKLKEKPAEGMKYNFKSWGNNQSITIAGTANAGYNLTPSDNKVEQILHAHINESLKITIEKSHNSIQSERPQHSRVNRDKADRE